MIVIQSYEAFPAGVQCANADVKLRVGRDPPWAISRCCMSTTRRRARIRRVATCGATLSRRIGRRDARSSFQAKAEHVARLSVSFLDRNRVAYTHWVDLRGGGAWQTVRVPLDQIRPNPYFQPPGANTGAPIDVSEVARLGFAPQDKSAGQLVVSRFVVE